MSSTSAPLSTLTTQPGHPVNTVPVNAVPVNSVPFNTGHQMQMNHAPQMQHQQQPGPSMGGTPPHLVLYGDLNDMKLHWTPYEQRYGRRIVEFWRECEHDNTGKVTNIHFGFQPIEQTDYQTKRTAENNRAIARAANNADTSVGQEMITVSCIYWREKNDFFITSVDCINFMEKIIGIEFPTEEKNRIRRNLEGFHPYTVSKTKQDTFNFFRMVMGYPHPKPRNIEKDVKMFTWSSLIGALDKVAKKYASSFTHKLTAA
jgi:hypothetical protein